MSDLLQGRLAQAYASLVGSLWAPGRRRPLNPSAFKKTVARLNEQFAGNEQHDAQELLNWLLNGLSEDLNRIAHKPFIEQPDRCTPCGGGGGGLGFWPPLCPL